MARKKIIAGNWKMNMTPSEAVKLVKVKTISTNDDVDVVFCVPAIDIVPVVEAAKAQTLLWRREHVLRRKRCIHRRDRSGHVCRCRC